jgi:histidine triad (HIT) family protein
MMEHLSEEQVNRLNEISKLPQEQQQVELQKFLSALSPEEMEFLKSQQKQQCLFCSIVEWQISQYRIYEDNNFIGILDINPASKGHVIIIPKKHYKFINEVEEDFSIPIKKIVNKVYEILQADTSIIIHNGTNAGQKLNHTSIHIIPRYKDDNIKLEWQSNKASEEELKELSQKLKIEKEILKVEEKIEEIEDYYEEERIP